MNYEQAMEYIHAVQWAGHKPGLTRTRTLLAALGDPHKKLQFVHVAGTNGKGSTAAMLASCLQAAGYRVGLYTSPFINRFNERIQINGQQIPDEALVALVEQVKPAADAMEDVPTEFEIITALGMLYFAQQQCDIVVLEVGLGGTLDSTNVIDPPECAVITALGMDHVKELGPTIADIAAAKAGILKPGSPVVSYGGVPEADAVIARTAAEQTAPLHVAVLLGKAEHPQRCDDLELGGHIGHGICGGPDRFHQTHQFRVADLLAVHLNALIEPVDEGRGVQPHPIPRSLQAGCQHGSPRPHPAGKQGADRSGPKSIKKYKPDPLCLHRWRGSL